MREPRSGHPAEPLSRRDSSLGVSLSRLTRYHQTTWSCPIWGLNASACSKDCCARVGARQKPAREASTRSRLGSSGKSALEPTTAGNRPNEEGEVVGAARFFGPTALSRGPPTYRRAKRLEPRPAAPQQPNVYLEPKWLRCSPG